jgi:hypothetical protein
MTEHCVCVAAQLALEEFIVAGLTPALVDKQLAQLRLQPSLAAATCDGQSLYAYQGVSAGGSLSKIGTGLHGTLVGTVTASVENLAAQVDRYRQQALGMSDGELQALKASLGRTWECREGSAGTRDVGEAVAHFSFFPAGVPRNLREGTIQDIAPTVVGTLAQEDHGRSACFINAPFDFRNPAARAALAASVADGTQGNYWEFEVLHIGVQTEEDGADGIVAVGMASETTFDASGSQIVGWDTNTFGYHSDDGNIFVDGEHTGVWPPWTTGDTVGCGLVVTEHDACLFFTHNGARVPDFSIWLPIGEVLLPVVCFVGAGCIVKLNSGSEPFVYEGPEVRRKLRNSARSATSAPADATPSFRGALAVSQGVPLFRGQAGLGSCEVVELSPSLSVRAIHDIARPIAERRCQLQPASSEQDIEVFTFVSSEAVDIRSASGASFGGLEATWAGADVSKLLWPYVNADVTALYVPAPVSLVLPTNRNGDQTLTVKVHCAPASVSDVERDLTASLCLPFAAAGDAVVCLETRTTPEKHFYAPAQTLRIAAVHAHALSEAAGATAPATANSSWQRVDSEEVSGRLLGLVSELWAACLQNSTMTADPQSISRFWGNVAALGYHGSDDAADAGANSPAVVPRSTVEVTKLTISYVLPLHGGRELTSDIYWGKDLDFSTPLCSAHCTKTSVVAHVLEFSADHTFRAVKEVALKLPSGLSVDRNAFGRRSLLFNGAQMTILPASTEVVQPGSLTFDLRRGTGDCLPCSVLDREPIQSQDEAAARLTVDPRNHLVWAWNAVTRTALCWRTRDPCPSLKGVTEQLREQNTDEAPVVPYAAHKRGEQLQQRSLRPERGGCVWGAALLLTVLQHQAAQLGPTDWEHSAANADHFHLLRMQCIVVPGEAQPKLTVLVQGSPVRLTPQSVDEHEMELHIVVLDDRYRVHSIHDVAMTDAEAAATRVNDIIERVPDGRIVLVCGTEVHALHVLLVERALGSVGMGRFDAGRNLLLVGQKGMQPGSALMVVGKSNETINLESALPVRFVPLAVDLSAPTVEALLTALEAVLEQCGSVADDEGPDAGWAARSGLVSAMRLLRTHVFRICLLPSDECSAALPAAIVQRIKGLLQRCFRSESLLSERAVEDAVLGLFVTAVGVLYPTLQDLQQLMYHHIGLYRSHTITRIEVFILEFVLKRMSEPGPLLQLLQGPALRAADDTAHALDFFSALEEIFLGETERSVGSKSLGVTAVTAMEAFCKLLLTLGSQPFVSKGSPTVGAKSERQSGAQLLARTIMSLGRLCATVLDRAKHEIDTQSGVSAVLGEEGLAKSPVYTLLPLVLNVVTNLATHHKFAFLQPVIDTIGELAATLSELHLKLRAVLECISAEERLYIDATETAVAVSQVYESEHPYRSNMDQDTEISFPGASSVSVTFDAQSRTENGCDYLQFRDANGSNLHPDRLTGRDGSEVSFFSAELCMCLQSKCGITYLCYVDRTGPAAAADSLS